MTFYVSRLRPGDQVTHQLEAGRRAFLYLIDGAIRLNGERLGAGDQARLTDLDRLTLSGDEPSEIILIDLP